MKKITLLAVSVLLIASFNVNAAEWKFDKAHSTIKFKVKHLLTNTWGEFTAYDGTISYNPQDIEASKVIVNIDASSIDTENAKRDGHLKSPDFFDVANFPEINFVAKNFKRSGDGVKVDGFLTMHGVTKEVTLDVDGPSDPINFMGTTKIAASAQTKINRTDFGLTWNKTLEAGNLLVGEEVTILIDLELDRID